MCMYTPHMLLFYLVGDLSVQSYPDDHFEVIFVNDHSLDGSKALLNNLISEKPHFLYLDMPSCLGMGIAL